MTEEEWLSCDDPGFMLEYLQGKVRDRQFILFSLACSFRTRQGLKNNQKKLYEAWDKFAEGRTSLDDLKAIYDVYASGKGRVPHAYNLARWDAYAFATNAKDFVFETHVQVATVHDIFGNPFRPVTIDPRWLTSTVVDLASTIYQDRAFDRMSLLADALMDAGCDSEEVIAHCRSEGPHVRGCWVVDLLLDKK